MYKKTAPLGTIMKLLNISLSQLAERLHVDKTTISKWRTGSRTISEHSPYFEHMTTYFCAENSKNELLPLNVFFKGLYPGINPTMNEYVSVCLRQYLSGGTTAEELSIPTEGRIATPKSTAVFRGPEGRKNAMEMLFSVAENLNSPCQIHLLELDQVEWLCRDMSYIQMFVMRLDALAKKGCKIEICYFANNTTPEFRIFLRALEVLLYNDNYRVHIINTEHIAGIAPSIYAVLGHFTAVGFNCEDSIDDIYTNVFFDEFTNSKYLSLYKRIIERYGKELIITADGAIKDTVLQKIAETSTNTEGGLHYYGTYFSVITMEETLLHEIIAQNTISEQDSARCIRYYHTLRTAAQTAARFAGCHFYVNNSLIESTLAFESIVSHELSALVGKQIIINREQYRLHLQQTADFIHHNLDLKMVIVSVGNYQAGTVFSWLKKNTWCLLLNNAVLSGHSKVIYFDDGKLIKIFTDMSEQTSTNTSTSFE